MWSDFQAGYVYLRRGDLDNALRRLERGMALSQSVQIRYGLHFIASLLGSAYVLAGRLPEAIALHEQAIEWAGSTRIALRNSDCLGALGEAYLRVGRLAEAVDVTERALALSRERKERGFEAWTLWRLGEIYAHSDRVDSEKAEACYRRALGQAEMLGMRPLLAHCHRGLGRLLALLGKQPIAIQHLEAAVSLYRDMGMRLWLSTTESELRGIGPG